MSLQPADFNEVANLCVNDLYIGCGSKRAGVVRSKICTPFPLREFKTRQECIDAFERYALDSPALLDSLHELSGYRLLCHCHQDESCHGDVLIMLWRERVGVWKRNVVPEDGRLTGGRFSRLARPVSVRLPGSLSPCPAP